MRSARAVLLLLGALALTAPSAWARDDVDDGPLREKLATPRTPLRIHWDEGFYLVDRPRRFTVRANLRVDLDFYGIDDDAYVREGGRAGNTPSGSDLRRGRVTFAGVLGPHHHWKLSAELTSSTSALRDSYVDGGLLKSKWGSRWPRFRVGNFMEPTSLEQNTPSSRLTYMERASVSQALGAGRSLGAMAYDTFSSRRVGYAAGVFWSPASTLGSFVDRVQDGALSSDGVSLTGRLWWFPLRDCSTPCHRWMIAASGSQRIDMSGISFRSRPESYAFDYLVDTDFSTDAGGSPLLDDANQASLLGLETSYVRGPWFAQGEFLGSRVGSQAGGNPLFWGAYAMVGCWLTGECRRLDGGTVHGTRICNPIDPCKERRGAGGLELAARFSTLDLNDGNIAGGSMQTWSLALNWHLNHHRRVMFNFLRAQVNDGIADAPIYLFQMRMQLVF